MQAASGNGGQDRPERLFRAVQTTGRTEAMLGNQMVATIYPHGDMARYKILLPGHSGARLVNKERARSLVLHMLIAWFDKAGMVFAPVVRLLKMQAELEQREAA